MPTAYPNIPRFASPHDVVYLAISWDAWVKGKTATYGVGTTMIDDPTNQTSIVSRYGYRAPVESDGTTYPDNWYTLSSSAGNIPEQTVIDDQLMMLAECEAVRFYVWYPPAALCSVGGPASTSDIYTAGLARHKASARANGVQIAYILQSHQVAYDGGSPGTWGNESAFIAAMVADMQQPYYKKITQAGVSNRPIIGLFKAGVPAWDATHKGNITTAVTNAGLGTPVYIQMNADVTESNSLSCQYITAYGPSGAGVAGSHNAYSAQITKSLSVDSIAGANAARCLTVVHCSDGRPRSLPWTDVPTYTQIERHLRDRFDKARAEFSLDPAHLVNMYALNENDEGGDFFPTAQTRVRGVNTPSRGVYLDALKNVRNSSFPSTYDDHYTAWTFHANVAGSLPAGWAIVQDLPGTGGANGAFQYAELQNSTTTNARTWTVTTTRIRVYGGKRVGLGHIGFSLDGGAATDVDQGALVGTGYNQLLYDSGTIANTSHTLAIARISGTAAFDEVVVSVSR